MGGGRRVADQCFRAAKADRQLQDGQGIQEAEGSCLAALYIESKGRAGGKALAGIHRMGIAARLQKAQIMHFFDLVVIAQIFGDDLALSVAFSMRIFRVSRLLKTIQQVCGSIWLPMAPRRAFMGFR